MEVATPEISLAGQVVYIGRGLERQKLETIYGKEFDLNTMFFAVKFHNYFQYMQQQEEYKRDEWNRTYTPVIPSPPAYISYEAIKEGTENGIITLELHKLSMQTRCRQLGEGNSFSETPFEDIVRSGYERFREHPNLLAGGEPTLIAGKVVIKKDTYSYQHGENGYPFESTQS